MGSVAIIVGASLYAQSRPSGAACSPSTRLAQTVAVAVGVIRWRRARRQSTGESSTFNLHATFTSFIQNLTQVHVQQPAIPNQVALMKLEGFFAMICAACQLRVSRRSQRIHRRSRNHRGRCWWVRCWRRAATNHLSHTHVCVDPTVWVHFKRVLTELVPTQSCRGGCAAATAHLSSCPHLNSSTAQDHDWDEALERVDRRRCRLQRT